MRLRIFALAFGTGFVFLFTAAVFLVVNMNREPVLPETEPAPEAACAGENAVFLLVFDEGTVSGGFTLVSFDTENGRVPVMSFSAETALTFSKVTLSAGELFSSVSHEAFSGAVENTLGIELSGFFVWSGESCEAIISASGAFDMVLERDIKYRGENGFVSLVSGVQSVTGKKALDIIRNPDYSALGRCDMFTKLTAAFINRRIKRLHSGGNGLYPIIFENTETDVDANKAAVFGDMAKVLGSLPKGVAKPLSADMERDSSDNLLYIPEETMEKIVKYFTK